MWESKNTLWESDDKAQTFQLKRLYDQEYTAKPSAPLGMLIGAKRHKRVNTDLPCTVGDFPTEFSFCPFCKEALLAPENKSLLSWLPPYGNCSGLKITSTALNPNSLVESSGQPFALPSMNGRFSFCSAKIGAAQRLLIALQRDAGKISIYQPDVVAGNKWRDLEGKLGSDDLPEWSWSLATDATESGLAIPTATGPAWVTVDWASERLQIDRGEGCSVAGIARLGKLLLAPVMRGNQFFILYRKDGDAKWSECKTSFDLSIVASQLTRNQDQLPFLGIPVIDETRMVAYWACRGGYVKVVDANPGDLTWEFRAWESDVHPATALIELGPPYKKIGSRTGFWQLCEDYDPSRPARDALVYKIIKIDGDELTDAEELEYGQFVSTGRASFSGIYDHWDDVHQINPNVPDHKDLRYPLLQFGDKGLALVVKVLPTAGQQDVGSFSELFSDKSSVLVRFVIEGAGIPEKALVAEGVDGGSGSAGSLFELTIAQLPELGVFIYASTLYITFPDDNKCFGWPLEMMDS